MEPASSFQLEAAARRPKPEQPAQRKRSLETSDPSPPSSAGPSAPDCPRLPHPLGHGPSRWGEVGVSQTGKMEELLSKLGCMVPKKWSNSFGIQREAKRKPNILGNPNSEKHPSEGFFVKEEKQGHPVDPRPFVLSNPEIVPNNQVYLRIAKNAGSFPLIPR